MIITESKDGLISVLLVIFNKFKALGFITCFPVYIDKTRILWYTIISTNNII